MVLVSIFVSLKQAGLWGIIQTDARRVCELNPRPEVVSGYREEFVRSAGDAV